jgi:di/tricarboxylate transporter
LEPALAPLGSALAPLESALTAFGSALAPLESALTRPITAVAAFTIAARISTRATRAERNPPPEHRATRALATLAVSATAVAAVAARGAIAALVATALMTTAPVATALRVLASRRVSTLWFAPVIGVVFTGTSFPTARGVCAAGP